MHALLVLFAVPGLALGGPEPSPFPAEVEAPFQQAYRLRSSGDLRGAEKLLGTVTQAAADNPRGWNLLGQVYLDEQRPADAEGAFSRALSLGIDATRKPGTLATRAVARMRLDKLDAAVEDARAALALDPHQPLALLVTATSLARRGQTHEARVALESLVKVQPEFATAHELLAATLAEEGDYTGAEKEAKRARDLGSKEPSLDDVERMIRTRREGKKWNLPLIVVGGGALLLALAAWLVRSRKRG